MSQVSDSDAVVPILSCGSHAITCPDGQPCEAGQLGMCQFCRTAEAVCERVSTVFGVRSLCADCVANYREQVRQAVEFANDSGW